jgi:hypothetical protein
MEAKAMSDDFANTALQQAAFSLQEEVLTAQRAYEDSQRYEDTAGAGRALQDYLSAKQRLDSLVQAANPPQANGQLSNAQRNFLSRRQAGGDVLDENRLRDYRRGHDKAMAAGLELDSPQYFRAVEHFVDHLGDGRKPVLDATEAAKISGVDPDTYNHHAKTLRALKARGMYQD